MLEVHGIKSITQAFVWRKKFKPVAVLSMAALMSACAVTPESKQVAPEAKNEVATENAKQAEKPAELNVENLNLDAQTMFQIMAAEMMLKRGQPKAAFDTLYPITDKLREPELAQRLFQISMSTYDLPSIEKATYLWRDVSPESSIAWRASFLLALRKGQVQEALDDWDKFQKLSEANLASDLIGSATKVGGSVPTQYGMAFFQKLTEKYPEEWASYYALGMVSTIYQDAENGIPALLKAKSLMEKDDDGDSQALIYNLLSKLYMSVEPPQKGVEALRPYVEKHPTDLLVQERLARLEVQAQYYEAAEKRYEYIVEQEPMAHTSLFALALLQLERDAFDKAEQNLIKVSKQKGYQSIAFYYLGILYQEQKLNDKAKSYFEQVQSPGYQIDAQLHLAEIFYSEDKKAEALKILDAIKTEQHGDKVKVLRARAIFETSDGRYAEAVAIYEKALAIEPGNTDVLKAESLLLYKLGLFDEYETALLKALKVDDTDSEVLNALGYYYVENKVNLDTAFALLQRALQIEPQSYFILDSMGWYYYQTGDYQNALEYLNDAFNQSKDDEVLIHLISAYWANGERQKAREIWQQYHQDFNENSKVQNIIKDLEESQP